MRIGIFGKLPVKRDFIALNLPQGFLHVWEEWLQASVAASRQQLGEGWKDQFLTAPIWRFWLGRDICGQSVTGALMPSVDGVGRYFPLCICACAEDGPPISPPGAKPLHRWFDKVERALLQALGPEFSGEPSSLLAGLDLDAVVYGDDPLENDVTRMLGDGLQKALAGESWWWSIGGGTFPVQLRRQKGLPGPYQFAGFMTYDTDSQSKVLV